MLGDGRPIPWPQNSFVLASNPNRTKVHKRNIKKQFSTQILSTTHLNSAFSPETLSPVCPISDEVQGKITNWSPVTHRSLSSILGFVLRVETSCLFGVVGHSRNIIPVQLQPVQSEMRSTEFRSFILTCMFVSSHTLLRKMRTFSAHANLDVVKAWFFCTLDIPYTSRTLNRANNGIDTNSLWISHPKLSLQKSSGNNRFRCSNC